MAGWGSASDGGGPELADGSADSGAGAGGGSEGIGMGSACPAGRVPIVGGADGAGAAPAGAGALSEAD